MPEENKARRVDLWKVKYSQLALHPNVREDLGEITELVESIKLHGVKNALRGYRNGGLFCIVDGSRRFAAMEMIYNELGTEIECSFICQPNGTTDEQILLDQFITNDGGKPLTPLEQAYGVQKFIEHGWDTKKIAHKLGKSETYIKRLLTLVHAPADFIALIKKKDISATFAMEKVAEGKASVEDFMKTHTDGGFSKYEEQPLFDDPEFKEKESKQAKITKKDVLEAGEVKQANSWNEFKKYADKGDYTEMWEGKIYSPQEVFFFMLELKNNNMSWDGIRDFFMATKEVKEKKVKDDISDKKPERKPLVDSDETVVREYPK